MSDQKILAKYVDGVFQLIDPEALDLAEGEKVILKISPIDHAAYIIGLAKQVYAGLSEAEIAAIEEDIRRRPLFGEEEIEPQTAQGQTT